MVNESIPILLFLIAHFLGDFQLQSEQLAETKKTSFKSLFKHISIHAGLIAIIVFIVPKYWKAGLIIILAHLLIDMVKKHLPVANEKVVFILDQLMHLAVILTVNSIFNLDLIATPAWLRVPTLQWVLLIIVITKPINTTFKILFSNYQPETTKQSELKIEEGFSAEIEESAIGKWLVKGQMHHSETPTTIRGAGANIGTLERVLAALLLSVNQYAALGIIFTAKSITRYDKISKDPVFAEYYLIGTLFSILAVILCYQLIF
ncbi:DUF3307 domain-containing protein [Jeotgalibaca sp. A127]|uniref:DUF3307 domain-containing protein n=1 Tax=Jeotgalibaca sp. A127 TaxID=3457324 RepID=UPI003FD2065B